METMTSAFVPVLPDPPIHHPSDYTATVCWADVKHVLVYREQDGYVRVITCETEEEFEAENLATTFSPDYELIDTWSLNNK